MSNLKLAHHARRGQRRYEEHGYTGLIDRRRGRVSERQVPLATVERVLQLYHEQYFDFNVRHFHEKLVAQHDIKLSYTWVKRALQGAGLVKKGRKRGAHRKRRPRRPLPGMLLHIDDWSYLLPSIRLINRLTKTAGIANTSQ